MCSLLHVGGGGTRRQRVRAVSDLRAYDLGADWSTLVTTRPRGGRGGRSASVARSAPSPSGAPRHAASRARRLPPAAAGTPAAVGEAALLQQLETVAARGSPANPYVQGRRAPAARRSARTAGGAGTRTTRGWAHRSRASGRAGGRAGAPRCGRRPLSPRSLRSLPRTRAGPHRRQRLVERGADPVAFCAVPARPAIATRQGTPRAGARAGRLSPSRQHTARAFPSCEPHRRTSPSIVGMRLRWPFPVSHASTVSTTATRRLAGRNAELDQRDEPPVRAAPFGRRGRRSRHLDAVRQRARTLGRSSTCAASGGSCSSSRSRFASKTIPGSSESSSQSSAEAVVVTSVPLRAGRAGGRRAGRHRDRASTRASPRRA